MTDLSRLRWLCRRGMKELDLVMTGYLEIFYADAEEIEQHSFRNLLEMPDPELFALLVGKETCDNPDIDRLIVTLRGMVKRT